jgi:PilZ domain
MACIVNFICPTNLLAFWHVGDRQNQHFGPEASAIILQVEFDSMDEHRIATRHRVLEAGTIEFGGGAISCTVRNISATGAALDIASPLGIPAQFTLVTDGNHLPCRIVWRKEKRIGVTFELKP